MYQWPLSILAHDDRCVKARRLNDRLSRSQDYRGGKVERTDVGKLELLTTVDKKTLRLLELRLEAILVDL